MMNLMEKLLSPEAPWVYIVLCVGALLAQSLCFSLVRDTLPPAVAAAKAIVSLFFLRVFVYRQGFTGAPKYEYAKRGK